MLSVHRRSQTVPWTSWISAVWIHYWKNCQKYCQCAGYTVYKFLNIVLSQACMEGFLPELISPRNEYPVPDSDIRLYNKEQLKKIPSSL